MQLLKTEDLYLKLTHYLNDDAEVLWLRKDPIDLVGLILSLILGFSVILFAYGDFFIEMFERFLNDGASLSLFQVGLVVSLIFLFTIAIPVYRSLNGDNLIIGFTKDYVFFIKGGRKKKSYKLYFEDLKDIRLVEYNNKSTSTIYFMPAVQTPIRGFNEDRQEDRIYPTFEEVEDGPSIYLELKELLQKARQLKRPLTN